MEIHKPRARLTGSQWADRNRIIPPGTSPEPGPWRTSRVPYLQEIVDVATDSTTQRVVVMSASQIGKSELLLNVLGYFIDQEPSPILLLQPTVEAAQDFSKERIDPMIQATDALRKAISGPDKGDRVKSSRKSSDTILKKNFKGGYLALVGSNATTGLASRPIRVVLMDEVDRYGETKEGDPVKLAEQRTRNFHNRKIIKVSTPTFFNTKIHSEFKISDQREFYITCPGCGEELVLSWDLVKWKLDSEHNLIPDSVCLPCPHCGYILRDRYRIKDDLLKTGKWIRTADSEIAGFHLCSLYSPWVDLLDLVREYLRVKGNQNSRGLQEFTNLQLGLPFDPYASSKLTRQKIAARREIYPENGAIDDNALVLTAGVDVQRDRVECSIYGWGVGYEAWLISHDVLPGDPKSKAPWDALDQLLFNTPRFTEKGKKRNVLVTFIDSGDGYDTAEVYAYTGARKKRNVFSIKGRGGFAIPFTDRIKFVGTRRTGLYEIGVDAGKSIVMGALGIEKPGPGFIHFPKDSPHVDGEYFQQLLAEQLVSEETPSGETRYVWRKLRRRNEALDCAVYARAAIEVCLHENRTTLERIQELING